MKKEIDFDAFSSGQISSKIWLCEALEKINFQSENLSIYILGGWYGLTAFLLLSRGNLSIKQVRSFDISKQNCAVADLLNENWVWREWTFKAIHKDVNEISYDEKPDLVINTSTEHIDNLEWWHKIPSGTTVALQGTSMPHPEHTFTLKSLSEFQKTFKLKESFFSDELTLNYPDKTLSRFMVIGKK